ncbi:MAG TPA: type II toxin-antitoxin system VapC family toxin [Vicinamibacterales bacterium]|nr:type II toxin-antitoxin system VapC family toxin [Vicinamibacterales bacterium]
MTLDSSALVAVLFAETGYLELVDRILSAGEVRVGAPTLVEASLVLTGRRGARARGEVEGLIAELGVTVVPFGDAEWRLAVAAFTKFGRGRHPAALNFGDCLAYATAMSLGDSLLFVGGEFARTDVPAA